MILTTALLTLVSLAGMAQSGPKLALGTAMPAFALTGVDGKTLDSKSRNPAWAVPSSGRV